ncbi:hypothetical protein ACNJYD_09110 [Bradyrhizobium sp. DASA03005]|uniref:hypothetical protein n=1 Tax=Bradyrhizobium sp. SPXBL-02 TaxID=3395912 RepID=UPI003F71CB56
MPKDNCFAKGRTPSIFLDQSLLSLSAVTTAILFGQLLYYCSYGLDISSEGFYLTSIANPFPYVINVSASLFGFVYHWPYQWAGGDVAVLRMANVTLTMALGWVLSFLLIRLLWTTDPLQTTVLSAGIACLTLCHFNGWGLWGRTPTHYSLTFQSLLVVMIGLLLLHQPGRVRQVLGWILVGVGGWCCFMARPPTAAAVAILVVLYVIALRRKWLLPMLGSALIALALLDTTAYLIDGSVTALVTRIVKSAEMDTLKEDGHGLALMFRIDWLPTSRSEVAIAIIVAIALLVSILSGAKHNVITSLVLAAGLIATIAITLLGIDPISIQPSTLFLVAAFTCLGAILYRVGSVPRIEAPTSIALALALLVLPHLSALGSNMNYWLVGSMDALFWILAALAILSLLTQHGRSVTILLPLVVLAQLLTASIINAGILRPYRQVKDLRAYTAVMQMPSGNGLVLSQSFYDYLAMAKAQARTAGLEVGAPVIYLTGFATSLQYLLQTRPLGLPWLTGGSSGSNAAAVEALRLESCADLAKAWIIIEPDGPNHLDHANVIASFGAVHADYATAARLTPPMLEAGYPNAVSQFLLKPIRPAELAQQSCRDARRPWPDSQKLNRW